MGRKAAMKVTAAVKATVMKATAAVKVATTIMKATPSVRAAAASVRAAGQSNTWRSGQGRGYE